MKKLIFTTLLALLAFGVFAQTVNLQESQAYAIEYSSTSATEAILNLKIENYQLVDVEENGELFTVVQFENGINTFKKGFAELPMLNVNLQLNPTNDVKLVVLDEKFEEIKLTNPILPSRGTIYRNQDIKTIPYVIAPESIIDAWYPADIVESAEPFILRDARGVNIYVYPFQYNAANNTLRIYKSIVIGVEEETSKSTNPLTNVATSIDPMMNDVYKSLFINYSETKFANQLGEVGEMLVIYTSRDASAIEPFITWKREKGFKVHTQQVATNTNVKTTIQNAYNANPNLLYVQLVGDWADIKSDLGTGQNAPMDPMLGCVAGSDFYPELIIGRFSANSAAQVTVQVNKAINYEKNPDMGATWYKTGLGLARNEGAGQGDDGEGDDLHMERIRARLLTPSYNYSTVYQEYDGNSTYVSSNTTSTIISSRINNGVSVINFANHGSETGWSVGSYSATHVNNLTNASKLPIIFSVACVVGKFHRTTGDCFAETWLKKENGGAVATIMSTINQPWIPPMRGQDYFNDILIGGYNYSSNPGNGASTTASDKRTTFGSITFNGNVLMLAEQYTNTDTRETFQTWTIFGDASLQIRTDTPKPLTVTAGDVTGNPYSVTVTSNGTPMANAMVALSQNGNTFTALTNSSGVASVSHSFTSGQATLTVSGYNLGTYQGVKNVGTGPVEPPVTPTGLAASNITDVTATLSWGMVSGATSYDLQIRPQGGTFTTQNVTSNSVNVTGLTATTTYEWQVRAKNSAGNSAYSSLSSFTTLATVVTYCASKGNNAQYEWIAKVDVGNFSNSSGSAGYTDFTSQVINLNAGQTYSISLTPGFASTTYNEYWKIWIDLNGDGDFGGTGELVFDAGALSKTVVTGSVTIPSGTASITTRMRVSMKYNGAQTACETFSYGEVEDYTVQISAGATPPAEPTGLISSNITASSFSLSWNASTGATSYDVQIRPQGGSWSTFNVTSTSYNATSLSGATTYEAQVRAKNSAGSSSYTSAITVTTLDPIPAVPAGLSSTSITTSSATLTWNASTYATSYDVQFRTQGGTWSTYNFTTTTCNATGLNANTTYEWQVRANNSTGSSNYSTVVNFTTLNNTVTLPTVSTSSISNVTSSSASGGGNVTADGGASVTERGVVFATTQNPTTANSKVISGSGTGSFSANITGLAANTTYYVRAYAINSAGTSYGSQVSFTTTGGTISDVTIGTGTSTQGYPLNCYYGFERSASLYTASELGKTGSISKLGWYPTVTTSYNIPVKIYIKHTTATSITATSWANMISGATLVFNGTMNGTTANVWKEFVLSTAFEYSGGSNNLLILVETNYGGTGTGSSTGARYRYSSSSKRHMYVRADNSAPTGNGTISNNRPNIRITITTRGSQPSNRDNDSSFDRMNLNTSLSSVTAFPNPTNGMVTIKSSELIYTIEVFSIAGKKVAILDNLMGVDTQIIDLSQFESGIYLLVVDDGVKRHMMKMVKY